jgi:hypothetical protein
MFLNALSINFLIQFLFFYFISCWNYLYNVGCSEHSINNNPRQKWTVQIHGPSYTEVINNE